MRNTRWRIIFKTKGGPWVAFCVISHVLSAFDDFFDLLFEAVDTCNGEDVGQTEEDDGDADEDWERDGSGLHVHESEDTENDADDAQQQEDPPVGEAHLLIVEARDEDADAFDDHPDGEHQRQRHGGAQKVEQEEAAEEDVEQSGQHAGAAVRHESLCPKGKHQFGDTREQGQESQNPCRWNKRDIGVNDEVNAEGDEKNACDAEPDFFTFVHK